MNIDYRIKHMLIGAGAGLVMAILLACLRPERNIFLAVLFPLVGGALIELVQEYKLYEHEDKTWMQAMADVSNYVFGGYVSVLAVWWMERMI